MKVNFWVFVLDHKLCWKPHIKYLCMKMARSIGILSKTRYILNQNAQKFGEIPKKQLTKYLHIAKKSYHDNKSHRVL